MSEICVIGGSRYFGRRLIENLRDAGTAVTVVNRGSAPAPEGVTHLRADRDDEDALRRVLGGRHFDVVIDQVCYTPVQAAVALRAFAGRTTRYVMTSTVEVYAHLDGPPHTEDVVDPATWPVATDLPWDDPAFLDASYGEGKRQAEAVFTRDAAFGFVSVRTAHVLGGADFTGRLAHYVQRIRAGLPVIVHENPRPASFVHEPEIARFLAWAARADFTGPVNAASHGTLDVRDLCAAIGEPVYAVGEDTSPFSFDRGYAMDNGRATALGFRFSHVADWLPSAVQSAVQSVVRSVVQTTPAGEERTCAPA
ncbi:NAD-dependent epimerase/dehydratase family protein [Microbispora hainanensis]|uniref:NAD-dependent epimerase/dehydratase family protein n=1 Tax=Microbispora hainanensis TaxID=568844 RepID=UPI002E2CEBEF|nr:NAD-dependent epimerase/dehydratase family protein [Microbispora hainanensis]